MYIHVHMYVYTCTCTHAYSMYTRELVVGFLEVIQNSFLQARKKEESLFVCMLNFVCMYIHAHTCNKYIYIKSKAHNNILQHIIYIFTLHK
jgi:hypothetical protein